MGAIGNTQMQQVYGQHEDIFDTAATLISKVQRQQVEAKEVFEGEMCGLSLKTEKKLLLEEGDTLEFFTREIVKRTLQ